MAPKRIRVELFPYKTDIRRYYVTAAVSSEKTEMGSRYNPFVAPNSSGELVQLNEDTKATILKFYDIDGVRSVSLEAYTIEVRREPAFDWDDIHSDIITTIKYIVGWNDDVIIQYLKNDFLFDQEPALR